MLTVKTYVAPSSIHGVGLFAAELIPAQTVIWQFNQHIDKVYSDKSFLKVCQKTNEHTVCHLLNCSYIRGGRFYYVTDNARFINHADQANIAFIDDLSEVALRQIEPHEEILENYFLSYDAADFFFHECTNQDPNLYLHSIV